MAHKATKTKKQAVDSARFCKLLRVSQAHLEIGLHRWQEIISPYNIGKNATLDCLSDQELDKIIFEIEDEKAWASLMQ